MGRSLSTRRTASTQTSEPAVPAYGQAYGSAGSTRRQAFARAAQRAGVTGVAVLLACALGFGLLMLATPSSDNARELAETFDQARGAPYPGVAVPFRFAAALEATEDHRFDSEPGIDPVAVLRVMYGAMARRGDQGGATLYQQLAKMLYTPGNSSMRAEAEQIALAVKLKYAYSRPEILRLYADVAYFGHGFYGLAEASCGYFGVPPGQMSWPQAALLAGLVQGPTADDPIDHPAAGLAREEHVIGRLVAVGALTQGTASRYLRTPVAGLTARAGACRG
jgi:membrane peptidoglycan carboxypeptidase